MERAEKAAGAGSLTESQAREILSGILERTQTGESLRTPSASDWLRDWLTTKELGAGETTMIRYRQTIEHFITHLGQRAKRPLLGITPRDVQDFYTKRAKDGVRSSTINVDGKTLRAAFTRAVRLGVISNSPADAVDLPARRSNERGTFSPEEVDKLAGVADGEWKTLINIAYYTGARLSECCRVTWENIDLEGGLIKFAETKTDKIRGHAMPLHALMVEHLNGLGGKHTGPIMPGLSDVRVSGRRGLSQHFIGLMAKAGIDSDAIEEEGKRTFNRRSFHALRHSFASALANAGVSPELRMKLTGHKSESVHRGYTHHELEKLKEALAKLPAMGKKSESQAGASPLPKTPGS
jgi:integrase